MRIAIDPNVRIAANQTYAGFEDVFGDVDGLNPGDWVTVMWQETDMIGDAKITCIEYERRLIDLVVDWNSFRKDVPPVVVGTVTITSGGRTRRMPLGVALEC